MADAYDFGKFKSVFVGGRIMDITQTFYDNMASQYDKLFLDWNALLKH